jgi:ABC-2 type transport system permease protein
VYAFSVAVYTVATGVKTEVENASVAIVDEDQSELSERIGLTLFKPYFKPAVEIRADEIDPSMDSGRFVFVIELPPKLEADILAGRQPIIQVDVDATAMSVAGKFNPNFQSKWFHAVMAVINNITILTVILAGAAFMREREHGTIEHLLVMPVKPAEIMVAKIWANGLVIVLATLLSLWLVVGGVIQVPIAGSMILFGAGTVLYVFSIAALGILLATFTDSMGQFALLALPVLIALNLLSGSVTPMESMPQGLQDVMQFTPTPHFVAFAQAVLFRGAGLDIVWPQLCVLAGITIALFGVSLARFRSAIVSFR